MKRRGKIRNERIKGTTREFKKHSEKRTKLYGHVMSVNAEHIVRKMIDADIPGKRRRRGWPNLRCKDACKRDMTAV